MKILLISYYFAPYNTIGAVRVTKMVKYLERLGHDVKVISAANQPLPATLTVESKEQNIFRTKFLSLQKLFHILLGGRQVIEKKGYQLDTKPLFIRKLASIYKTFFHFPDGQIGWYPFAVHKGRKLTKSWKPDVILASGGPFSGLLVAKKIAKETGTPWIADLRDLWVDNANYSYPSFRKQLERMLERKTLSSASALITVSDSFASTLRNKYKCKVRVIMNGFDEEDYKKLFVEQKPSNEKCLTIAYTGMIYANFQDVSPLFSILERNKHIANKVKVNFYGRGLDAVHKLKDKFNLDHCVNIYDPVSHKEIMKIQAETDILLLLLWNDPKGKGVYPGKLFEYFGARRPILAIGDTENAAAHLITSKKRGFVSYDEKQMTEQLNMWVAAKAKGNIAYLPVLHESKFTRKEQTNQLVTLMNEVISDSYE
jgi:glycosyltransferase involved in cell wall biosynthesis